ncbi:hypothetical protein GYMLUDRAFT_264940 [Collybiopsis luxurians FD-317 M1]|uniref:Unplaced genomic scaffold GYMLUscaffold_75, whole genome shotgun sequence n=1 Tax=Collybiopsis luxurians FD-317 M1 TaxID=944289 RepID=A0A0D0BGN6_9AGAR|nr:hypothetical protein GYMLUDRAFT_264940 [Collybiopsis luxurians FD-317 M1]
MDCLLRDRVLAVQLVPAQADFRPALTGTLTPGQTTTFSYDIPAIVDPIAVIFSPDGGVPTTATTIFSAPSDHIFSLVIPVALTGTNVAILASALHFGVLQSANLPLAPIHTTPSSSSPPTPSPATTTPLSAQTGSHATPGGTPTASSTGVPSATTEAAITTDNSRNTMTPTPTPTLTHSVTTAHSGTNALNSLAPESSPGSPKSTPAAGGPNPNSSQSPKGETPESRSHLAAIIGGALGGALAAVLILIALYFWCQHRRERERERPATFHWDMMVKSRETPFPMFNPFGVRSIERGSRRTESVASLGNSSMVRLNGKTNEEDGLSSLPGLSLGSEVYETARRGFGQFPSRTDRQMELELKIHDLKAQLISLSDGLTGSESTNSQHFQIHDIKNKIRRLEDLEFSDWAMELTDEVPKDFLAWRWCYH